MEHRVQFGLETPLGGMCGAIDEGLLVSLKFCEGSPPDLGDSAGASEIEEQIQEYFSGWRHEFEFPMRLCGTDFERSVWAQVAAIPYGRTATYGEIAARLGTPPAARAVGQAVGANPLAIVVPCHRVVGAAGKSTGYAWGLRRKQALLDLEADLDAG